MSQEEAATELRPLGEIPVVGFGGSVGSLAALRAIVSNIPAKSGAAYVVVVHLLPEGEALLAEILGKDAAIPVIEVSEQVRIEVDTLYVISPGKQLTLTGRNLKTVDLKRTPGRNVTIDVFFRSLADAHRMNACAVVLSGADADGSLGLKRVKERGGLTIAQEPSDAEFEKMPRASVATGMVDWVVRAGEIPARLADYWANRKNLRLPVGDPGESEEELPTETDWGSLREILAFLKERCGHDFAGYKHATVLRRVGRRMQVNGTTSLSDYLGFLRTHPGESGALLQDLLISVTNFFRDEEAFRALQELIPSLFEGKSASEPIRVWVTACATGEEAYSIAILLHEHAATLAQPPPIQIFATDLDANAITMARRGLYPQAIETDVSEERLLRFFNPDEKGYRVKKAVRDSILFAAHDLLKDSPFSKLDLIACRNLLIYLDRKQGKRVSFPLPPGSGPPLIPGGTLPAAKGQPPGESEQPKPPASRPPNKARQRARPPASASSA